MSGPDVLNMSKNLRLRSKAIGILPTVFKYMVLRWVCGQSQIDATVKDQYGNFRVGGVRQNSHLS